jgi:hypothetical protein
VADGEAMSCGGLSRASRSRRMMLKLRGIMRIHPSN